MKAKVKDRAPRRPPAAGMSAATVVSIRTRTGLSQAAFAAKLAVDRVTVARWETGTVTVTRATAALIHQTFDIRTR